MGLRFRRTVTLFPGVRLNIGKGSLSLSLGPRGASFTIGGRGAHANLGIPGTGLSYRTRLHVPASGAKGNAPIWRPSELHDDSWLDEAISPPMTFERRLRSLLADREREDIDWPARAAWLHEPVPDEEDEEAFEAHARRIALARFARRMVEGDRAAWSEVIREELINEDLPFGFAFEWGIDGSPERIYVGVELPGIELLELTGLATMKVRELHEDTCCALLLRFAHELFRVIAEADDVYLVGYRPGFDPATGLPVREIYLRLATDRESFDEIILDQVDPSTAFEGLGGVSKRLRGELVPISLEGVARPEVEGRP